MDGIGDSRVPAYVTVQGSLRREIEWGYRPDEGTAWARSHIDVAPSSEQTSEEGYEVLLEGQWALDAAKRYRPGDLLRVFGELVISAFETEDGVPGRLLEIHALSVDVLLATKGG